MAKGVSSTLVAPRPKLAATQMLYEIEGKQAGSDAVVSGLSQNGNPETRKA